MAKKFSWAALEARERKSGRAGFKKSGSKKKKGKGRGWHGDSIGHRMAASVKGAKKRGLI